jgi:surfeit locus 1 family protein
VSTPAPDYSFLWKPRWILSHLFILALVVTFVSLGFWQLRRLDERRTYNALVESRQDLPAATVAELLPAGPTTTSAEVNEVIYRPLTITGTYAPDQEVLVRNRTYSEVPGYWVLTPLVQRDGTAVVINRGWVPFDSTNPDGPWTDFAPPTGVVTVVGKVQASQVRSSGIIGGPKDADEGTLRTLSRVDIGRLQQQVDETLYPISVDLTSQDPAQVGLLPVPIPPPELDEGPHLNYAGQWFIFATLTVIVYPLLMRRVARNKGAERAQAESDAAERHVIEPEASRVADVRDELSAER